MSNPKLSTMSDEQISRVIAEFIEPKPTTFPRGLGRTTAAWTFSDELQEEGVLGEMQMVGWQPRDFVNDPACTLMLLEKLMTPSCFVHLFVHAQKDVHVAVKSPCDPTITACEKTIGRSVALAFIRANGLGE